MNDFENEPEETLDLNLSEQERRRFANMYLELAKIASTCAAAIDRNDARQIVARVGTWGYEVLLPHCCHSVFSYW